MLPNIEQMMLYKNKHVFRRYEKDFPGNTLSAEEAFQNLMKYFWLAEKHRADKKNNPADESLHFLCGVHYEMHEIDDMWHTFLLFTKDYANFCELYFGCFRHHAPTDEDERMDLSTFELELTRYLSYVYDNLGEETVRMWFADLM